MGSANIVPMKPFSEWIEISSNTFRVKTLLESLEDKEFLSLPNFSENENFPMEDEKKDQ